MTHFSNKTVIKQIKNYLVNLIQINDYFFQIF